MLQRRASQPQPNPSRLPGTAFAMLSVLSTQIGSAVATHLFHTVGPGGVELIRLLFSTGILLLLFRPRVRDVSMPAIFGAVFLGLVLAGMIFSIYSAIERIPLGIAVALEFVGPLGIAVFGSRRLLDLLWAAMAAAGIILLTPWGGLHLDPAGVVFALLAGGFWAAYILSTVRVNRLFRSGNGLGIAMAAGAVAIAPVGIRTGGAHLLEPRVIAIGLAIAFLSSAIPYSLDLAALHRLPTRIYGVLQSTQPAVGALVGLIFLGQVLGPRAVVAILLIMIAAAGASVIRRGEEIASSHGE